MKVRKLLTLWSLSFSLFLSLGYIDISISNTKAQTPKANPLLFGTTLAEKQPPTSRPEKPGGSRARVESSELPWDDLYEKEPPRSEEVGGSRSPSEELCPVSPESWSEEVAKVWSDRPLFVWRGKVDKIELRRHRSSQVVWTQTVTEDARSIVYDGVALQPGETYNWVIFEAGNSLPALQVTFQVISAEERTRIATDLKQLEEKLKKEGATPEKIAYERAGYFADRQMWPDVIQSAYSVKDPSATLTKFREGISKRFCNVPTALGQ